LVAASIVAGVLWVPLLILVYDAIDLSLGVTASPLLHATWTGKFQQPRKLLSERRDLNPVTSG